MGEWILFGQIVMIAAVCVGLVWLAYWYKDNVR